jgi:hypothetical protein
MCGNGGRAGAAVSGLEYLDHRLETVSASGTARDSEKEAP